MHSLTELASVGLVTKFIVWGGLNAKRGWVFHFLKEVDVKCFSPTLLVSTVFLFPSTGRLADGPPSPLPRQTSWFLSSLFPNSDLMDIVPPPCATGTQRPQHAHPLSRPHHLVRWTTFFGTSCLECSFETSKWASPKSRRIFFGNSELGFIDGTAVAVFDGFGLTKGWSSATTSTATYPRGRRGAGSAVDGSGVAWFYGGRISATQNSGELWKFEPTCVPNSGVWSHITPGGLVSPPSLWAPQLVTFNVCHSRFSYF